MTIRYTTITTLLFLASLCTMARGQNDIPNGDFENWSTGDPVDWTTTNSVWPGSVTQSSQAQSGVSAAKCTVVEVIPGLFVGPSMGPANGTYFPVSAKWAALRGYVDLHYVGGDRLVIQVIMLRNGNPFGVGSLDTTGSTSGYSEFVIPLLYAGDSLPTQSYFTISTLPAEDSSTLHAGSEFLLDNLHFSLDSSGGGCLVALTGDANVVGGINSTDIIYLVNYVLKAGSNPLPCPAAGDVNCSGNVNLTDVTYLVNYVLKGGPPPCDVCTLIPGSWSCP